MDAKKIKTEVEKASKKKTKFYDDFKKFAFKGNVIDMAVGIIIGGAFTTIVSSLVNNILMPLISFFTAGIDFSDMKLILRDAVIEDGNTVTAECSIGYGVFIQNIIYFLLVAISVFIFVKIIHRRKEKKDAEDAAAAKAKADAEAIAAKEKSDAQAEADRVKLEAEAARLDREEKLLTEIRDLLKKA